MLPEELLPRAASERAYRGAGWTMYFDPAVLRPSGRVQREFGGFVDEFKSVIDHS